MGLGAHFLIASGLVPGIENNNNPCKAMTLTQGLTGCDAEQYSQIFVVIELLPNYQRNIFTQYFNLQTQLLLPLATKQGRFVMTETLAHEIYQQGLNLFNVIPKEKAASISSEDLNNKMVSDLPFGVQTAVACSNKLGNVLATTLDFTAHEEAAKIFYAMQDACDVLRYQYDANIPLYYLPRPIQLQNYQPKTSSQFFFLEAPENQLKSARIQVLLQARGLVCDIKCYEYIELDEKNIFLISNHLAQGIKPVSLPKQEAFSHANKNQLRELLILVTEDVSYKNACARWGLPLDANIKIGEYWGLFFIVPLSDKELYAMIDRHYFSDPLLQTIYQFNSFN